MRLSYSVKTKIRKDKKKSNGTYPLYHQVIFNSEVLKLSIPNASLKLDQWDEEKEAANRKFHDYKNLNYVLLQERLKIEKFLYDCRVNNITVNKRLVKEFYNGADQQKNDFYHHFDQFYARKATEIRKGTLAHYALLRKQLKEYRKEITLKEVNYSFLDDFFHYLKTEKQIGPSGIAMRRKNLVTVFEYFKKKGIVEKNPAKDFKKPKEVVRDEFLTPAEVRRIEALNLDIGRRSFGLNLSRDLFLFSCYTGLRYGDVVSLRLTDIKANRIEKVMEKTGSKVAVPLLPKAKELIDKYKSSRLSEMIFPNRSNVSVNRDLKYLARRAKINKRVSHHTGRHSFGSILGMQGVQPFYIMKLMGHKDVRMTNRYVKSNNEILSDIMEDVTI